MQKIPIPVKSNHETFIPSQLFLIVDPCALVVTPTIILNQTLGSLQVDAALQCTVTTRAIFCYMAS